MEDGKYREALSSFDRALPSFAHDNQMVIRILNGRGNAYYFLEEYPACVESYHKAMMIDPSNVRGKPSTTWVLHMRRWNDSPMPSSVTSNRFHVVFRMKKQNEQRNKSVVAPF